ncbi:MULTISPECIES: hypothetical protein [Corallococcus]|uniref:hypothetical protein n=1 Tax=Corallococcus TaxID=83461 RepID=UPI001180296B|nr:MULTISPECIES: hypothetical protein [Corallococcus]NBD08421.1 hypothetical protein [Corallococcus silvisoli]TSC34366.1 hypothetical protein FOF48_04890 [Corallococcus sp. Z5C101001]
MSNSWGDVRLPRWCLTFLHALWSTGLVLLAGGAHGEPPTTTYRREAQALFGRCKATADGSTGRRYLCPNLSASIGWLPIPMNHSNERVFEGMRDSIIASADGAVESKKTTLVLAGVEREALEVTIREEGTGELKRTGHVIIEERTEKGFWAYTCMEDVRRRGATRPCKSVLEFFASQKVPEPLDLRNRTVLTKAMMGTRELMVPDGCDLTPSVAPEVGRIKCPSSFLEWAVLAPEVDLKKWLSQETEKAGRDLRQRFAASGASVNGQEVACRVLEQQGLCHRYRVQTPRSTLWLLLGAGRMGKEGVRLVCSFTGESEALPTVCNGSLELQPTDAPRMTPR